MIQIPARYKGLSNEQLRNFVTDIEIFKHDVHSDKPKEIDLFGLFTEAENTSKVDNS